MKKIHRLTTALVFVFALTSLTFTVHSQSNFGHINTDELLRQMPGRDSAQAEIENYARQLEQQFVSMQNEFQQKYQDFLENESEYSDLIRQSKQRELSSLQDRILEFQESAQDDLMRREERLLRPIIEEARNAIQKVAEENNYSYVFDTSTGVLLHSDPGDNIMSLVKKELGLE